MFAIQGITLVFAFFLAGLLVCLGRCNFGKLGSPEGKFGLTKDLFTIKQIICHTLNGLGKKLNGTRYLLISTHNLLTVGSNSAAKGQLNSTTQLT